MRSPSCSRGTPLRSFVRLACLAVLLLVGCVGCVGRTAAPPPTRLITDPLTLPQIVERLNANTGRLPSLWARGLLDATLYESRGADPLTVASADVYVQHLKPEALRLKVEKVGVGDVLDLGTDGDNLWLLLPRDKVLYTGTSGRLDPRKTEGLPVRPDLLLQVLGVNDLPTDLLAEPAPTLRVNPDLGVYMLTFVEPATLGVPRLTVSKEVWLDGDTLLPRKVILYDEAGRVALRADVGGHVEVPTKDDSPGAKVATVYDLYFPETLSAMRFELQEVKRRHRGAPRAGTFTPRFDRYDLRDRFSLDRDDRRAAGRDALQP